jgi:hypothetical protein
MKVSQTHQCFSEKNKDDTAVRDDLISFLEKPLPPPLPYQCQHCSQSFTEENDLKIHQSVHNSELICLACRKTFTGNFVTKNNFSLKYALQVAKC